MPASRRVELRQVGPREQGRLCGEVGLCGTGRLCSARYPCHDQPITLKMAKEQDLPMNPGRITGLCGRLRCCLAFEHPLYRSFRDRAPAVGRAVATPNGRGIVRSYEVLKDACVVETGRKDDGGDHVGSDGRGGGMSDVAFWGAGGDPALGGFKEALRAEWVRRGYEFIEGADPSASVRVQLREPGRSEAVPPPPALDVCDRRAHRAGAARRRAAPRVPDAGAGAREPGDAGRPRRRLLLRDAGAGHVRGPRSGRPRRLGAARSSSGSSRLRPPGS